MTDQIIEDFKYLLYVGDLPHLKSMYQTHGQFLSCNPFPCTWRLYLLKHGVPSETMKYDSWTKYRQIIEWLKLIGLWDKESLKTCEYGFPLHKCSLYDTLS